MAVKLESLPSREAWIEIKKVSILYLLFRSLPSREAWIEILPALGEPIYSIVASLAGSVD